MKRALQVKETRNPDGTLTSEWVHFDDTLRTPGDTPERFVVMGRQGFNVRELDAKSRMRASIAGKVIRCSCWTREVH